MKESWPWWARASNWIPESAWASGKDDGDLKDKLDKAIADMKEGRLSERPHREVVRARCREILVQGHAPPDGL